MNKDEADMRVLSERWAQAVHAGDIEGVLADHAPDIVMFDVPPPANGVHGIDAYGATWPPFFAWQKQGAAFEIVALDVTAGTDVAYAHALHTISVLVSWRQFLTPWHDPVNHLFIASIPVWGALLALFLLRPWDRGIKGYMRQ